MPQFDQLAFLNQVFWLFILFFFFYFFLNFFFLPILLKILKYRKKMLNNKMFINLKQKTYNSIYINIFNNNYLLINNFIISLKINHFSNLIDTIKKYNFYKKNLYNNYLFKFLILTNIFKF